MTNFQNLTLGEIARDFPGATAVFHKAGLDFCCGGGKRLQEAAEDRGLDAGAIASELSTLDQPTGASTALSESSDAELIEHILARYHDVHREQLPELIRLSQQVERVHGGRPECPAGLAAHLQTVWAELESHMAKEEEILFPMISRGIKGMAAAPVSVMRHEHDEHGSALATLERLTNNITLPEGACNTWQALYTGLNTFRNDLMNHIHIENNILFNRIDGRMGGAHHG